ncbi:hypothetical protein LUZ60_013878 [Juncus effusus]|nr:hypothetical protein LUZ60_013878 [Juncus effusus]
MERTSTIPAPLLQLLAGNSSFEVKKHRMLLEIQQMVNRYNESFSRLRLALTDLNSLNQENLELRAANLQLNDLISEKEKLILPERKKGKDKEVRVERSDLTPPSIGSGSSSSGSGGTRAVHPKNISIRSREFLAKDSGEKPRRLRVLTPSPGPEGGDEEGELEVEMEVFAQGMEKTELCNKWAEGGCPYSDKCRFAHGLEELRPVLRHPRYKTQVCRMFHSDTGCPYGHRCHFKHAVEPGSESAAAELD